MKTSSPKGFLVPLLLLLLSLPTIIVAQTASNLFGSAPVISSIPASTTCTGTPVSTINGTTTYTAITGACNTSADMWYQFVAKSTNPTISFVGVGTTTTLTNARVQIFSNPATVPASHGCGASVVPTPALVIGNTYYIRIYSNTAGGTGNFSVCVRDPAPANDVCSGSLDATAATCVSPISGNMYASTLTAAAPNINSPNCASGATYDMWYTFRAQSVNPTISLTGVGSAIREAGIQLLARANSSVCTNAATPLYCAITSASSPTSATITANHLTVGTTYFLRVYSTGTAPTTYTNSGFNLCISHPVAPAPFNDTCLGAINLPISGNCDNYPGTIASATLSPAPTITSNCAPAATYDVWYKFTAISTLSAVNVTNVAANFTGAGFQILSGNCSGMTSLGCGTPGTELSVPTVKGTTYYIRVYSTTPGAAPTNDGIYNICVRGANAPLVKFGNSYVNISKKTTGGVVQPGDTLEIRMTINHKNLGGTLYQPRFVDSLPTKTAMLATSADSIRIITNEGLTYKKYSITAAGDPALYNASPGAGQYHVRLNVGLGTLIQPSSPTNTGTAAATATGTINPDNAAADQNRPRGGGGVLFAIAYRVRVTGVIGDTIVLNGGKFIYSPTSGGSDTVLSGTPFKILISNPQSLCANSMGLNNALEDGGTFGSGTTLARTKDLSTPIANYSYVPNPSASMEIGDGRYSIVKNVSPRNSVNRTARRIPNCNPALEWEDPDNCNNRMYTHWVIDGDHSGTNTTTGNTPPAINANGGYMLLVNADYVASEAYRQQVNNLCPNTYYEFSAWIRNVCSTCGADSLGNQFTNSADVTRHAGVVGVYPNLSFAVDGIDQYSTGEVDATGWQKRGFVFQTGPSQTSATFTIRNNSQGGGGNDWAMDDISVSTCLPTMSYSPRGVDSLCMNNLYVVGDTIRSVYNTYTNYRWQRKRSYESSWTDLTGNLVASPTFVNGQYEFVTNWTLPPSETQLANNGDQYRVVVATTSTNLSNNSCTFSDSAGIYSLRVMNCNDVLDVRLISFTGILRQGRPLLTWTTTKEHQPVSFTIEKSIDGINFYKIANVSGYNNPGYSTNNYNYSDSVLTQKTYYRVVVSNSSGRAIQSKAIMLANTNLLFSVDNLVNPFDSDISLDVTISAASKIEIFILDANGHEINNRSYTGYAGVNRLILDNLFGLAKGVYVLQVRNNGNFISKKVVKQ